MSKLLCAISALCLVSLLVAQEKPKDPEGFVFIFDGQTLEGWEGDTAYWRVESGILTGEVTPDRLLKRNSFIIWQGGKPTDFELKLDFRISERGNSGVQYRSILVDTLPFALKGYQADIDGANRYTGMNYEERGRTTLAQRGQQVVVNTQPNPEQPGSLRANVKDNIWQNTEVTGSVGHPDSLAQYIRKGDWNEYHLVVKGNKMRHYINGQLMSEVTDNDTVNRAKSGLIGMQVHTGPPMKVEFRNVRLKEME